MDFTAQVSGKGMAAEHRCRNSTRSAGIADGMSFRSVQRRDRAGSSERARVVA